MKDGQDNDNEEGQLFLYCMTLQSLLRAGLERDQILASGFCLKLECNSESVLVCELNSLESFLVVSIVRTVDPYANSFGIITVAY